MHARIDDPDQVAWHFAVPSPYTIERRFREMEAKLMKVDQITARAWADAGIIPVARYVELCRENGWTTEKSHEDRDDPACGLPALRSGPDKPDAGAGGG